MPYLFAFREDRLGFRFEIDDRIKLGRAPECDLIVFDRAVSRLHTEIYRQDGAYYVRDLKSTNGTFLNGVRLEAPARITKNAELKLGEEILLFDPELDVAVGREGVAFIVGELDEAPRKHLSAPGEPKLAALERAHMAALFKVAGALARCNRLDRVLRQITYSLEKLFDAGRMAVLWPDASGQGQLTALAVRPLDDQIIIPLPMVRAAFSAKQAVGWKSVFMGLDFIEGERILEEMAGHSLAVPLFVKGQAPGLLYIESLEREYSAKDLNFLSAMASLFAPAIASMRHLAQLNQRLARQEDEFGANVDLVGEHAQIKALRAMAAQSALTRDRLMIEGEDGTGKEVVARLIHRLSPRKNLPFVAIDCASFGPGYIEPELFGSEAGAVGEEDMAGALERAGGGTVFLHNVDALTAQVQISLLKAIEEGVVYRVGSIRPNLVNFRAISSTARDLKPMVESGEFRDDLYHRLSELTLATTPLRELGEDIVVLARHFIAELTRSRGLEPPQLDPAAVECLRAYSWPGNADELKAVLEHAIMFHQGGRVVSDDLPLELRLAAEAFKAREGEPTPEAIIEVEKDMIHKALARADGSVKEAAEILGLDAEDLQIRIERYNISMEQTITLQISGAY